MPDGTKRTNDDDGQWWLIKHEAEGGDNESVSVGCVDETFLNPSLAVDLVTSFCRRARKKAK